QRICSRQDWSRNRKRPQSGRRSSFSELCRYWATVRIDTRPRTQGVRKLAGYFDDDLGSANPAAPRSNTVALSFNDLSADSRVAPEVGRFGCSLFTASYYG